MKTHSNHEDEDLSRRGMLRFLGGVLVAVPTVPLLGCMGAESVGTIDDVDGGTSVDGAASASSGTCAEIPEETNGPFPADGTNGVNALTSAGIVRSDIRSSFGDSDTMAEGVTLKVTLTVVDVNDSCAPLANHAVYIWHCDRDGDYSLYSQAIADENYLRGVQVTDANGQVTFTTIFPACYSGRWPHIHIEVYETLGLATTGDNAMKITQMAMPESQATAVYATTGYSQSVANLAKVSLATDMVFADGDTLELPSIAGSVSSGFTAQMVIGVS